jgi:magnesium-transporting ATPase (P-type)
MDHPHIEKLRKEHESLSADGFRVLALATREAKPREGVAAHGSAYGKTDENALTLEGYIAFLDLRALQSHKHTVGFLGDGINHAPALHAADVGISVDTALDIAKESADIILLEKS